MSNVIEVLEQMGQDFSLAGDVDAGLSVLKMQGYASAEVCDAVIDKDVDALMQLAGSSPSACCVLIGPGQDDDGSGGEDTEGK